VNLVDEKNSQALENSNSAVAALDPHCSSSENPRVSQGCNPEAVESGVKNLGKSTVHIRKGCPLRLASQLLF
jgi:hypothetical protein